MHKPRFKRHLDQALFVLVMMAGAVVSAVLDVQAISAAIAAGRYGLGSGLAVVAPVPLPPAAAASSGAAHVREHGTVLARLSH